MGCILLKTLEAGNSFSKSGKSPVLMVSGCLGDPRASGMTGTDAGAAWLTWRRNVRERFGVHMVLLSYVSSQL